MLVSRISVVGALGAMLLFEPSLFAQQGEHVVGIKLVKKNKKRLNARPSFASCPPCKALTGEKHEGENELEAYFHFLAPSVPPVLGRFTVEVTDPKNIRSVIVQKSRLPFHVAGRTLVFDVPIPADRTNSTEIHTHILEPGLDTRIEHAHPLRRAGPYAKGRWPALEHRAALNIEFALRQAVVTLGLAREAVARHLGTILLMAFDTNYPTLGVDSAHDDWPPHFHIHMTYEHGRLGSVGHFYLSPRGLITHNLVTSLAGERRELQRGEAQVYPDGSGKPFYSVLITNEGWLQISRAGGGACDLRPHDQGFQSGVVLRCAGSEERDIHVDDDPRAGILVVRNGETTEKYSYDIDTGLLLRHSDDR